MNRRLLIPTILLLSVALAYVYISYGFYDSYDKIEALPSIVDHQIEKNWKEILKERQDAGVDIVYDPGHHTLSKGGAVFESSDPIIITHIDDDYLVYSTGPSSFDSGLRYFILPRYSELHIISLRNSSRIKMFRFKGTIRQASIWQNYLYIRDTEGRQGRAAIEHR